MHPLPCLPLRLLRSSGTSFPLPSRVAFLYTALDSPIRRARAASARLAPVVTRSSTSTTRPPASSRSPPAVTSSAPAMFASRRRASSSAWSATGLRWRSTAATRAGVPVRRSSPAAASAIRRTGSCPRARTAHRAEGTGTSTTVPEVPVPADASRPARTAPAKAVPSAPVSVSAPRSLCARSSARTASAYGADAYTAGSPAGSGRGRTRRGALPASAVRQRAQSVVRGAPQPAQSAGSTRSVRSRHHPRMTTTVPRPEPAHHPCGQRPVDNSHRPLPGRGRGPRPGSFVQPCRPFLPCLPGQPG